MMKPGMQADFPSRFKRTSMLFLRGLLHTGCRRHAFKHALLDAAKAHPSSSEARVQPDSNEVRK